MPREVSTTRRSGGAQASSAGSWGGRGKDAGCVAGAPDTAAAVLGVVACCLRAFLFAFNAGWRRRCLLADFSGVSGCRPDGGVVKACPVAKGKGLIGGR